MLEIIPTIVIVLTHNYDGCIIVHVEKVELGLNVELGIIIFKLHNFEKHKYKNIDFFQVSTDINTGIKMYDLLI